MSSSISCEASAIRTLGVCVEHLAGIAEGGARKLGSQAALRSRYPNALGGDEVERVELPAGVGEKPREVVHPFEVSHSHRAPLELQRPVVALATKDAEVVSGSSAAGGATSIPLEDGARRSALDVGLPLVTAGLEGVGEAQTCERRFIGRPDVVPQSRCLGEQPFRVHRVALRKPHLSSSKGGAGDQCLALESRGNELQLLGG